MTLLRAAEVESSGQAGGEGGGSQGDLGFALTAIETKSGALARAEVFHIVKEACLTPLFFRFIG